jgi:hypothetical protein
MNVATCSERQTKVYACYKSGDQNITEEIFSDDHGEELEFELDGPVLVVIKRDKKRIRIPLRSEDSSITIVKPIYT